jgi:hypothetical protein
MEWDRFWICVYLEMNVFDYFDFKNITNSSQTFLAELSRQFDIYWPVSALSQPGRQYWHYIDERIHEVEEIINSSSSHNNERTSKLLKIWEAMKPKTQKRFKDAWKKYQQMCREYAKIALEESSKKSKPTIEEFRTKIIYEMKWHVSPRRLSQVIEFGRANILK